MIDDTKGNCLKSPSFEQALKFASDLNHKPNQLNDSNKTDEKISISYGKFLKVIEANQAALDKPENKDKLRDIATAMTTLANRRIQLKESNWFFIHTFFHKLISLFKGHGFQTKAAYGLHLAQTLREKALSETPKKVEEQKVQQESKTSPQDPIVKTELEMDAIPSESLIKHEEPSHISEQAENEKEIRDQPLDQITKEELPESTYQSKEQEPQESANPSEGQIKREEPFELPEEELPESPSQSKEQEPQESANPSEGQINPEKSPVNPVHVEEEPETLELLLKDIDPNTHPGIVEITEDSIPPLMEIEPNPSVNEPKSEIPKQVEEVKPKAPLSTENAETVPALLTFGLFREGKNLGEPSDLHQYTDWDMEEGVNSNKGISSRGIDSYKNQAATLATCFHTTENETEITDLIQKTREKCNPLFTQTQDKLYVKSKITWFNNMIRLQKALPGENLKKTAKIYWTKEVETILFPLFFLNEKVNIDDLVFAVVPGQEKESPYHADKMNYQEQLQFIGIGKAKYLGENYKNEPALDENPLMSDAKRYTALHSKKADLHKS